MCALIGTREVHLYIEHGDKDNDSSSIAYLDSLGISQFNTIQETNHEQTYFTSYSPTKVESPIQPMPCMRESLVDECIAIVNQFQWEDDCSHEEFIEDEDGFLDGDENASDNNDDEIIAAREKLEHYTKERQEFQEELREMARKRKHISKESIQGNGSKKMMVVMTQRISVLMMKTHHIVRMKLKLMTTQRVQRRRNLEDKGVKFLIQTPKLSM